MRDYKEIVETYDGQIYDDLWLFPRRGEGGDPAFHGAFIPQVPQYLAIRYTSPGDVVWDPMAGSGTTGDALKDFDLEVYMSDLVPTRPDIISGESGSVHPPKPVDLIILHPPYYNIIKFSDNPQCLSNCRTLEDFLDGYDYIIYNLDKALKEGGYLALVIGNIYMDGRIVSLPYLCMHPLEARKYKLKADYIKDIQGNAQNNAQNLWRFRHQKNGTAVFKHEHIVVFRK